MSNSVFPTLPGEQFPVTRTPVFDTTIQQAISGKETRIARQSFPRWKWELSHSVLRSAPAYTEFQQLAGFFNTLLGSFDSFLYKDADDNSVATQQISTGNGSTTTFQLIRTFGGFIEPVLAPDFAGTIAIYLNGVIQTTGYSVSGWGASAPGVITFITPPSNGVVITADFDFFWPCRMSDDSLPFELFLSGMYNTKKFSFISLKN